MTIPQGTKYITEGGWEAEVLYTMPGWEDGRRKMYVVMHSLPINFQLSGATFNIPGYDIYADVKLTLALHWSKEFYHILAGPEADRPSVECDSRFSKFNLVSVNRLKRKSKNE